jgi:hypothetical protein
MIKRSFRNYLLFPGAQLKHGILFVGVSTLLHGILTVISVALVDAWLAGKPFVGQLPFWLLASVLVGLYILFLLFIFVFGLFISHKWLGPLVPIEKMLGGLARGERVQRLGFRKGDVAQVRKIGEHLNTLADKLEREP